MELPMSMLIYWRTSRTRTRWFWFKVLPFHPYVFLISSSYDFDFSTTGLLYAVWIIIRWLQIMAVAWLRIRCANACLSGIPRKARWQTPLANVGDFNKTLDDHTFKFSLTIFQFHQMEMVSRRALCGLGQTWSCSHAVRGNSETGSFSFAV